MAYGMLAGIIQSRASGKGQVIDAAMVDGSAALLAPTFGSVASFKPGSDKPWGFDDQNRGSNLLDTGSHFYDTYETSDGKYISIGSIEPQFYALLLKLGGMSDIPELASDKQLNRNDWPMQKKIVEDIFRQKTREEW